MSDFPNLVFCVDFIKFGLAAILAFYIPGNLLIKKLHLPLLSTVVLSICSGIVLWAWQGYVFGSLNFRVGTYVYLVLTFVLWFKERFKSKIKIYLTRPDPVSVVIIIAGVILQLSAVWFMGVKTPSGVVFCCRNVPDGIYHLALTNELVKNFPPYEPGMSTVMVTNYHYWANLVSAELIRIFRLPLSATVYQYSSLLVSLFLGMTGLALAEALEINSAFKRWLLFFLYFSSDFIYGFMFVLGKGLNMNFTIFDDASLLLTGPPRAFSVTLLFAGLALLVYWLKTRKMITGIIAACLLGSLIGFKVYTGIFALSGMAALGGYLFLRRDYKSLIPVIITAILSAIIYLPANVGAGGIFFVGTWRLEDFIVHPVFGLSHLELARRIFLDHSNWLRVLSYEILFAVIYFVCLYGTNLIALFQTRRSIRVLPTGLNIFLISGMVITTFLGLFFWQVTGGANTAQFLFGVAYILAIYSALTITVNFNKFIICVVIILLTIPRAISQGLTNVNQIISGQGIIYNSKLVGTLEKIAAKNTPASILINPESTGNSYLLGLGILSQHPIFLGASRILNDHGVKTQMRERTADKILLYDDPGLSQQLIRENNIGYIYLDSFSRYRNFRSGKTVKLIYSDSQTELYEVIK